MDPNDLTGLDFWSNLVPGETFARKTLWYDRLRCLANISNERTVPTKMMPSGRSRILLVLLVIYIIGDVLLTPLGGLETRNPANVTTLGLATLGLLFTGLVLGVISLALLFYKPRRSPTLGIIAGILFLPAVTTEQAGLFSSLRPPIAIETLEIIQAIVSLITIFVAASITRQESSLATRSTVLGSAKLMVRDGTLSLSSV